MYQSLTYEDAFKVILYPRKCGQGQHLTLLAHTPLPGFFHTATVVKVHPFGSLYHYFVPFLLINYIPFYV